MCRPNVVCFFVYWHLNQESWVKDQDSGLRNRAIKHSLKIRQLILGYRGSKKMHKTIGTPPCHGSVWHLFAIKTGGSYRFRIFFSSCFHISRPSMFSIYIEIIATGGNIVSEFPDDTKKTVKKNMFSNENTMKI